MPLQVVSTYFRKALYTEHFTRHHPATNATVYPKSNPKRKKSTNSSSYSCSNILRNTNQSQCSDWGGIYSSPYVIYWGFTCPISHSYTWLFKNDHSLVLQEHLIRNATFCSLHNHLPCHTKCLAEHHPSHWITTLSPNFVYLCIYLILLRPHGLQIHFPWQTSWTKRKTNAKTIPPCNTHTKAKYTAQTH